MTMTQSPAKGHKGASAPTAATDAPQTSNPLGAETPEQEQEGRPGKGDSLAKRLCWVMAQMSAIPKTGENTFHKYRFIEASEVMAIIRPALARAGIVILPEVLDAAPVGKNVQIQMVFTLINAEDQKDQLVIRWVAEAQDAQDKAINKATTAAQKYMLLRLFLLSDKEDPDAEGPDPRAGEGRSQQPSAPQTSAPQPSFTERAAASLDKSPSSDGAAAPAEGSSELGPRARAFMQEITSAETRADIDDPKGGLVARIRAAEDLTTKEKTALFGAVNKRKDKLPR